MTFDYDSAPYWGRVGGKSGRGTSKGKLDTSTVVAIRESTGTQLSIAKRFGISRSQVQRIKAREHWTHI